MADMPLLGCPHCGKPVPFLQELASKLAACPHCRGAFTMPAAPPVPRPAPPPPAKRPNKELEFDPDVPLTHTTGPRLERKEPVCFRAAEQGSFVMAVCGTILSVVIAISVFWMFALEVFPLPGVRPFVLAMLWTLGAIAVLVGGIALVWTIRHAVLTLVHHARKP